MIGYQINKYLNIGTCNAHVYMCTIAAVLVSGDEYDLSVNENVAHKMKGGND